MDNDARVDILNIEADNTTPDDPLLTEHIHRPVDD